MKSKLIDVLLTILTLCLSAFLLYLFYVDVNRITSRDGQESLATISFKRNNAQRLYSDSYAWEKVSDNAPLYDGDTIRTGYKSEAIIEFEDKSSIDLADNTIVKISDFTKNKKIEFLGGNISFKGSSVSSDVITLNTYDGSTITIKKDANINLSQIDDVLIVGVDEGVVSLEKDGIIQTIDKSQEFNINTKSGEIKLLKKEIFLNTPKTDERYLVIDKNSEEVYFECEAPNINNEDIAYIELSPSGNFNENTTIYKANINGIKISSKINILPGTWYYRVSLKPNNVYSSTRRLVVYADKSVENIFPKTSTSFKYRKKMPEVNFSWTPSEYASSYLLEISDTEDFYRKKYSSKVYSQSIKLTNLDSGQWYYRVKPIYTFLVDDSKINYSKTTSFIVEKNSDMIPIKLNMPITGVFTELNTVKKNGILFSWYSNNESNKYELGIYKDKNLFYSVAKFDSTNTYFKLSPEEISKFIKIDTYFWSVRWQDNEGNYSDWAEGREFKCVDSIYSQRLVYPPDNYKIADSLITNTRFTWRSNIPVKKFLQISSDKDFTTIQYQQEVTTETMFGKNWPTGEWYWRIRALNIDDTFLADSDVRSFTIIAPLPEAKIINPINNDTIVLYNNNETDISWQPVPSAEYYSVSIRNLTNNTRVYDVGLLFDTKFTINFNRFKEGRFELTVRAGRAEREDSTRILGLISTVYFETHRIAPIGINYPNEKSQIDGLTAILEGVNFNWSYPTELSYVRAVVATDINFKNVVFDSSNIGKNFKIPSLNNGRYFWKMMGTTKNGNYNITSDKVVSFNVKDIPPLPLPRITAPKSSVVFDFKYFMENTQVLFNWTTVSGATHYDIELTDRNKRKVFSVKNYKNNSYQLDDLKLLSKGVYDFTVIAKKLDKNGRLIQRSRVSSIRFSIILPEIKNPSFGRMDGLYGN